MVLLRLVSFFFLQIYNAVYLLVVSLQCLFYILGTHPYFRIKIDRMVPTSGNETISLQEHLLREYGIPKLAYFGSTEFSPFVEISSNICSMFFTLDFLLRFLVCPHKERFFKDLLNALDLIIVLSLAVKFVLQQIEDFYMDMTLLWLWMVVRGVILLRLLRLFRSARYFTSLKIMYLALKASLKELGLLALCLIIASSLFGGSMFMAEFFEGKKFDNIPIGIWWSIVTITTVGYGDVVPTSTFGYIIGAVCVMTGAFIISMPIAVISKNFNEYHSQHKIETYWIKQRNLCENASCKFRNKVGDSKTLKGKPTMNGTVEFPEVRNNKEKVSIQLVKEAPDSQLRDDISVQ